MKANSGTIRTIADGSNPFGASFQADIAGSNPAGRSTQRDDSCFDDSVAGALLHPML